MTTHDFSQNRKDHNFEIKSREKHELWGVGFTAEPIEMNDIFVIGPESYIVLKSIRISSHPTIFQAWLVESPIRDNPS